MGSGFKSRGVHRRKPRLQSLKAGLYRFRQVIGEALVIQEALLIQEALSPNRGYSSGSPVLTPKSKASPRWPTPVPTKVLVFIPAALASCAASTACGP